MENYLDDSRSLTKSQLAIQIVRALKKCFYDLGTVFADLQGLKQIDGLKFKDFCSYTAKIDPPFVKFCLQLMEKIPEIEAYDLTIKQMKERLSEKKEDKPSTTRYLTIKLNEEQEKIFKSALHKFCIENEIDEANASSFFVETRCAEYLSQVDLVEDTQDGWDTK